MTIVTARAEIEARATRDRPHAAAADRRPRPSTRSRCRGTGATAAASPGDAANDLDRALAATRTSSIQEAKAFTCNVRAGRATARHRRELAGVARRAARRRARPRPPGGARADA